MVSNYCIYRYIDKNTKDILYVGKTDCSLENRINQHRSEDKFKSIDADVEYIELKNNMETRFLEFYFINLWKPALNTTDKYEYELRYKLNVDPEWKIYVPEVKEKPTKIYLSKEERTKIWIEKHKQKYIEEGTYFDLEHLHMNGFSKEEQELFVFICRKYLKTGDRCVSFQTQNDKFETIKLMLSNLQSYSLKYATGSKIGSMGYLDHTAGKPLEQEYEFTACISLFLKDEWIEDLIERYDAGRLN